MATLTKAERRRINRANGRKGGPKTEEGRRRSSRNALKHGLCAGPAPLPNEDPNLVDHEYRRWEGCYAPRTDHEAELVRRIASSCILRDRCERHYAAVASQQVENAQADIDRAHEQE